jgi:P4 family phage/plasmid primase-like protien
MTQRLTMNDLNQGQRDVAEICSNTDCDENSLESRLDEALLRDYSAINFIADDSKKFSKSATFNFTDGSVADCFKIFYEGKYVYCQKKMYHFNDVYWKQENDSMSSLSQTIDKDFCKKMEDYFGKKMSDAKQKLSLETDEGKREQISKQLQFLGGATTDLMTTLRKVATRKNFLNDICSVFCNEEQKWNLNPLIFCFENCCFDVKTGEQSVPNPEDYINVSCGYDYKPELNTKELRDELYKVIGEMLDKPIADYLLEVLSTALTGFQIQRVFILTGQGGNGKSVLLDLLLEMLGNYGYLLPQGFISKPIKEGGNPEASQIGGKRAVLTSEPDEKAGLCSSNIKSLTGDARLNVRELYSNLTGILLTLTFLMACNEKPKFDEINLAVRRRLEGGVISFYNLFVSQDYYNGATDDERVNLRVGDTKYQTREWRENIKFAFFGLLLDAYREKYLVNELNKIPARVKRDTNDYMASNDNIFGWICDNYVKDDTCFTTCNEIWKKFNSSEEFYEMTKRQKETNGTKKKFMEGIEKNIHLRRYFKPKDKSFNKELIRVPFLAGWREKTKEELDGEEEEEEVCGDDTSTVVDENE